MKRIIIGLLFLTVMSGILWAQTGDARAKGMANAFTGLADDVNAMYFNPAGMGFLKKDYLIAGTDVGFGMTKRIMFGEQEYPDVWESWDNNGEYVYWDDFFGTDVRFDPADYGFYYDPDVEGSYQEAVESYQDYQQYYGIYETFHNLYDVKTVPRLAWIGGIFGISTISDISIDLDTSVYDSENTEFIMNITKDQGLMVAAGIPLGIFGVGANVKYIQRKTDTLTYGAVELDGGPPEDLFQKIVLGSGTEFETEGENYYELGVGALTTLGAFNVGAYIDNLLFFLDTSEEEETNVDFLGISETMSVGASWTPFDVKKEEKRGILNMIASMDLKNFGDDENRKLAAGLEAGLNLGNVIVANGRVGYNQPLPGTLEDMVDSFDPEIGEYTLGVGAKFLFVTIDAAAVFPADMVLNPPVEGTISEERLDTPFAYFVFNTSINF